MNIPPLPKLAGLLLLINICLVATSVFAQPTVTDFELKKGDFNYAANLKEVPLNNFQIIITFNEAVHSANDTPIDILAEAYDMLVLNKSGGNDLFVAGSVQSLSVSSVQGNKKIVLDVTFVNDLEPNQNYTLDLVPAYVKSKNTGNNAASFSKSFTSASAVSVIPGVASVISCPSETATLSPIMLTERSLYSFVRNTTGSLQLVLSNASDFEFVNGSEAVTVFGGNGTTASITQATSNSVHIAYTIADDSSKNYTLSVSGIKVKFKGTANATTHIIAQNDAGRYNMNGLYSNPGNTPVALGTVQGKISITDANLDALPITGATKHCAGGGATTYFTSAVLGAAIYEWTIPANFTPQPPAISLGADKWMTTNNYIEVIPSTTGNNLSISVTAMNNCRKGAPGSKTGISITDANSPIVDASLNAFPITGETKHCAGGGATTYFTSAIPGATIYEWAIPANFTPQPPAIPLGADKWTTTNNYIEVIPSTTGNNLSISVTAMNNCRKGAPGSKTGISITDANSPIVDASLNAFPITGATNHCAGGDASTYFTSAIPGATKYKWTVPPNFNVIVTGTNTINLTGNIWQTENNFIKLAPISVGDNLALSVIATNACRQGTASPVLTLHIHSATLASNIDFSTPALGTFSGLGTNKNIANVVGGQAITVSTPGTVIFSGEGMAGNIFYPGIVSLGAHTISYAFTNANGCKTMGNFTFNVFDANIAIGNLLAAYCNNETVNQEFKVKTNISGVAVSPGNVKLEQLSPAPVVIPSSVGYTTGFGLKTTTSSDHIFVLKPDILDAGSYKVTVTIGANSISQTFIINPAPTPLIAAASGVFTVCANSSSTYAVTPNASNTYAWSLSGGGSPATGNGSSINIHWNAANTTQSYILEVTETNIVTQCAKTVQQTIVVGAQPSPGIVGLARVCANSEQVYTLASAAVAGHNYQWSVTGGIIASKAPDNSTITVIWGAGALGTIQLTEINTEGCQTNVSLSVSLDALSVPVFASGADEVCVLSSGEVYSIAPVNSGHQVLWEVQGGSIVDGNQSGDKSVRSGIELNSVTIDWGIGNQGSITVTETNTENCEGKVQRKVQLNPLPSLAFSGFAPQYCNNSSTVLLSPTVNGGAPLIPQNSRFIVRNADNSADLDTLSSEVFSPQVLFGKRGAGNYHMVFEYTDGQGCSNRSIAFPFKLDNAPQGVKLHISQIANSPETIFNATADNVNNDWLWQWAWQWTGGFRSASAQQNDTLDLFSTGSKEVTYTLKLENNVGCDETVTRTFYLDFGFTGKSLGSPTWFTDSTRLKSFAIDSWHWDFGDGNTSTSQNPSHTYAQAGTYQVVLTVTQGFITYSLTKRLDIFPVVEVSPQKPYAEGFDDGKAGWINHGTIEVAGNAINRNSWQLQPPGNTGHIGGQSGNVWLTNNKNDSTRTDTNTTFYSNEQSYVESPFFDITALDRPLVMLRYWADTDEGSDGVVLLYTVDDGDTWHRLGEKDGGLNWYNTLFILGNPGKGSATGTHEPNTKWAGWSGNRQTTDSLGWQVARLSLDVAKQQMMAAGVTTQRIRFRLAFGSNNDNPPDGRYEGFAFDDFQLYNRSRRVLFEYFGNQSMANADNEAHAFVTARPEAIHLHYHVGFPAADNINDQNPHDPSGRAFYYGVREASRMATDGQVLDSLDWQPWASKLYAQRTLLLAPFGITIDRPTAHNHTLTVSARVTALQDFKHKVIFQVAVIDTSVVLNGTTYYHAVRKMLPDAAGTFRAEAWKAGESQQLTFEWNYGDLAAAGFKVVVFVQDYETKEVYQAGVTTEPVSLRNTGNNGGQGVTGVTDPNQLLLKVYPNPAAEVLRVELPPHVYLSSKLKWHIVTPAGRTVKAGYWHPRQTAPLRLDVRGLAEGVYLLRVSTAYTTFRRRFEKK